MKILNILGLTILFIGIFAIAGFTLFKIFEDVQVPPVIRWGIIAVILGIIILLISLIRERIKDKNL